MFEASVQGVMLGLLISIRSLVKLQQCVQVYISLIRLYSGDCFSLLLNWEI